MKTRLLVLALLMLAAIGKVFGYDFAVKGFYFNIVDSNSVEVTYLTQDSDLYSGKVVIPKTVKYKGKTYNVTGIGDYAFMSCRHLTNVTISNSVTSIGYSAFYGCGMLKTIKLPKSIRSIRDDAFMACYSLTKIVIPKGVKRITGTGTVILCLSYLKQRNAL